MNKEIQITNQSPAKQEVPAALNQIGNDNTQIAYVQNFENNVNNVVIVEAPNARTGRAERRQVNFDYNYYNLFVIGAEEYQDSSFIVPKERALTENTAQDVKNMCATFSSEAIEKIKTFPALFASENHGYAKTDPDHIAYYGYVSDIKRQDNGIKIYFKILNNIPQQDLNLNAYNLGIAGAKAFNELNRTHWAIKRINLVEELSRIGISVFKI